MSEQQPDVEALTKTPEAAKAPATEMDVKEALAAKETAPAASTSAAASKPAPARMEDAPDPEEDDLDDLDGMRSMYLSYFKVIPLTQGYRHARRVQQGRGETKGC